MGTDDDDKRNVFVGRNIFESLKKGVSLASPETEYCPTVLIADSAGAITNGFRDIFGDSFTRVNCWFHVKKNTDAKLLKIQDRTVRKLIEDDINTLQLSPDEETFSKATKLFLDKWEMDCPQVSAFMTYFKKEWIMENDGWFEGIALGYPSTNNGLESTNRWLKEHHLLRNRLAIDKFLDSGCGAISFWSSERDRGDKTFSFHPEYTSKRIKKAQEWLSKGKTWKEVAEEDKIVFYIPSGKNLSVSKDVVSERSKAYRKFSTFVDKFHSAYTVVLDVNDWKLSTCTCPYFLKKNLCKHVYALACVKNLHHTDPYEQAPIGRARGPGRPKKALARTALVVESYDEIQELPIKRRRKGRKIKKR